MIEAIGLIFSLYLFYRGAASSKKSTESILSEIDKVGVTADYLAWFRETDQETIIRQIEGLKEELLPELGLVGARLQGLQAQILRQGSDLRKRLEDLNEGILAHFSLSPIPFLRPNRVDIPLVGRDAEADWLNQSKGDILVSGQPGSGKTELLYAFSKGVNARFVITADPDKAVGALLAKCPEFVIVDDAGSRENLLQRLQHARQNHGLSFRIVASCWPFDRSRVQRALGLGGASCLLLEGLPQPEIVRIVKRISQQQSLELHRFALRSIAQQANGMPGLAVSLTSAAISSSGEGLVSGDLLLGDIGPFLERAADPRAVDLLAAFACGGDGGLSLKSVADNLDIPVIDVRRTAETISLAGALEQTSEKGLRVQPEALRPALIKRCFLSSDSPQLPWELCETLIESGKKPRDGYKELLRACAFGEANVYLDRLKGIVQKQSDQKLWDELAGVNKEACEWVIDHAPTLSPNIKRVGLHYSAAKILPRMLESAVADRRPLHQFPDADLRLIEHWTNAEISRAVERRLLLLDQALKWLKDGKCVSVGFTLLRFAFSLRRETTDSDPEKPQTIEFSRSLLGLSSASTIHQGWGRVRQLLEERDEIPWPEVIKFVGHWIYSDSYPGVDLPTEYTEFLRTSSLRMLSDLAALTHGSPAVSRWIFMMFRRCESDGSACGLDEEFMVIYPIEEPERDWDEVDEDRRARVRELALAWRDEPLEVVVGKLSHWQREAESIELFSPNLADILIAELAEIREFSDEDLHLLVDSLPLRTTSAALKAALDNGTLGPDHITKIMGLPHYRPFLIRSTLTGTTPELYSQLEPNFPEDPSIEGVLLGGAVPESFQDKLLNHESAPLRRKVALKMFRSDPQIPQSLVGKWRENIIQELIAVVTEDIEAPYDLEKMLAYDPTIAAEALHRILDQKAEYHGYKTEDLFPPLVQTLTLNERRTLIARCGHLLQSTLPDLLVGSDPSLYKEMLSTSGLEGFFEGPLEGDPTAEQWPQLAEVALSAGHSPEAIARSAIGWRYSGPQRDASYWNDWIQRFEQLATHPNDDIKKIAQAGIKWSTKRCEEALAEEKRRAIRGE